MSEEVGVPVDSEGQLIGGKFVADVVTVADEPRPFDVDRGASAEIELQPGAVGQSGIVAVEVGIVAMNLGAADAGDRIGRKIATVGLS